MSRTSLLVGTGYVRDTYFVQTHWEVWRAVFTFIHWIADICNWIVDIYNSFEDIYNSFVDISNSIGDISK